MIPKPVRRIVYLFIAILLGYYVYDVVKDHTKQEVLTLKQYAKALIKGDMHIARQLSLDEKRMDPFKKRKKRLEALQGDIRFTYYKIKAVSRSRDGKATKISMLQIIRLNPPGRDSLWGAEKIVNNITAGLVQPKSAWKVDTYSDNWYIPGQKE